MKVLFWTERFWPAIGGIEVLAANLLPALAERGLEILVATDDELGTLPAHDEFRSIRIRRLGMRAALLSRSPIQIAATTAAAGSLEHEFAPRLIHINCPGASTFFLRRGSTRPRLVTLHGERAIPPTAGPALLTKLLAGATWVTAVCELTLAKASQRVPEISARSSVIYNAVAEPDEPPRPLPFDPPRIACLGRLAPEKGLDRAIDACAMLTSRHAGLRLMLCGDGEERSALEARARERGVGDKVDFTGWINPARVPEVLNTATLLLMPSRWEGLPMAGIEAALMARPIVATPVGGLPELIEDGVNGLLVAGEPAALAAAVGSLLDDPERAVRMGQAGRNRALDRFGWRHCVDSYHRLYENLAAGGW